MVVVHRALAVLSLATAISASRLPGRHAKRLFGLHFDSLTTTTEAPLADATLVTEVVTTIVQNAAQYDAVTRTPTAVATATPAVVASSDPSASSILGTVIYKDLTAIPDGDDRLAIWTLNTLSAQECHDLCAASSACTFYNVYSASSSYFHGSTPYCALYSAQKPASEATDAGAAAGLSYVDSDGYAMGTAAQVTVSIGTVSPEATAVVLIS